MLQSSSPWAWRPSGLCTLCEWISSIHLTCFSTKQVSFCFRPQFFLHVNQVSRSRHLHLNPALLVCISHDLWPVLSIKRDEVIPASYPHPSVTGTDYVKNILIPISSHAYSIFPCFLNSLCHIPSSRLGLP